MRNGSIKVPAGTIARVRYAMSGLKIETERPAAARDFYRKRMLRAALLRYVDPVGPVYVPFIGDGDLAVELYRSRPIFGADLDPDRVETATRRLTELGHGKTISIKAADCNGWPFDGEDVPSFAAADFDAYSDPYEGFRAFWQAAPQRQRMALFFTDGHRQGILRTGWFHAPGGSKRKVVNPEKRQLFNFYWQRVVKPWFNQFMTDAGWRIVTMRYYLRGSSMLYWGAVVEKGKS